MNKELFNRILSSFIMLPASLYLILEGSYLFLIFIFVCFFLSAYEWHSMSKNKFYNFLGFILLIFSFYSFYRMRIDYTVDYI